MLLAILATRTVQPTPPALRPGRVYKGDYPYWKSPRKPYWDKSDHDEEELLALLGIDLD